MEEPEHLVRLMKIKIFLCFLCTLILGIIGCNLFNPTETVNVDLGDSDALTYEGYKNFRNNNYTDAAYYFTKAIEADSSHSEAWYGLAKAKVNLLEINVFELLKYVNTDEKSALPIAGMDDATAQRYQDATSSILYFLAEFITQDTTGRLDGVITYDDVYKDVMVLDMFQFMLNLRKEMRYVAKCQEKNPVTGLPNCSIGDIMNGIPPERSTDVLKAVNGFAETCANKPEAGGTLLGQVFPGFGSMLSSEGQNTVTSTTCRILADKTKPSEDATENQKGMSMLSSFSGNSPLTDEDGDGCKDEEIFDDQDNDGDGEIDEDTRDQTSEYAYDQMAMTKNAFLHHNDEIMIRSVGPNDKYRHIDIDMDGHKANGEEWEFIYSDYSTRVVNNDHRFRFAASLVFNPKGLPLDEFTRLKHDVARDYYGTKYPLEYRKENIGGCWVRYSEADFQEALQAMRARYE